MRFRLVMFVWLSQPSAAAVASVFKENLVRFVDDVTTSASERCVLASIAEKSVSAIKNLRFILHIYPYCIWLFTRILNHRHSMLIQPSLCRLSLSLHCSSSHSQVSPSISLVSASSSTSLISISLSSQPLPLDPLKLRPSQALSRVFRLLLFSSLQTAAVLESSLSQGLLYIFVHMFGSYCLHSRSFVSVWY